MPVTTAGSTPLSESLWHDFRVRLRAFIAQHVRQPSDAEDILQEVFLRIHRSVGQLKEKEALTGWIYQITRNAIVDHYRLDRLREAPLPEDLEQEPSPELTQEQDQLELTGCLRPMIQNLQGPYREALVLTEVEGLSQVEAAARLGLSIPGMKSRVQRARRQLKELFLGCCRVELSAQGGVMDCSRRKPGGQACR